MCERRRSGRNGAHGHRIVRSQQRCARSALCVEPFGCCEPAHCEPHDCHSEDDDIRRSVEVVQAHQNAYDETGCEHREGNNCVTKSGRPKTAVLLNRSGRGPPWASYEREERDAEVSAVDRRGECNSNDNERQKCYRGQPCCPAVTLCVLHRAPACPFPSAERQIWRGVPSPIGTSGTPRASPRLEVEHPPTDVVPSQLVLDDQFTDRFGNPRGQPHA